MWAIEMLKQTQDHVAWIIETCNQSVLPKPYKYVTKCQFMLPDPYKYVTKFWVHVAWTLDTSNQVLLLFFCLFVFHGYWWWKGYREAVSTFLKYFRMKQMMMQSFLLLSVSLEASLVGWFLLNFVMKFVEKLVAVFVVHWK